MFLSVCLFVCLFFVFEIRIPSDLMCCKIFGRIQRRKFKEMTNKAIKTVENAFAWAFIIQD